MKLDRANEAIIVSRENPRGQRTRSGRKRHIVLASLALAHLLAGAAAVFLTYRRAEIQQALPLGITVASTCLLGVWVGLGTARFRIRLIGAAVGTSYTSFLFSVCQVHNVNYSRWFQSAMLMFLIAAIVAGPLLFLRRRRVDLNLIDSSRPSGRDEAFQFSLRHLLTLTFAFGLMCWGARASHSAVASPNLNRTIPAIIFFADFSLGFAATTGVILWMALGKGNPIYRCPVVILAAGANGLLLAYCFDRTSLVSLMAWAAVAALNAISVAVSLLVVRWCGYRLLRRASAPIPPASVQV
jgi:hypothetical protein